MEFLEAGQTAKAGCRPGFDTWEGKVLGTDKDGINVVEGAIWELGERSVTGDGKCISFQVADGGPMGNA